jgi:hypothetical protein
MLFLLFWFELVLSKVCNKIKQSEDSCSFKSVHVKYKKTKNVLKNWETWDQSRL